MGREMEAARLVVRIDAGDAEVSRLLDLAWTHLRNDIDRLAGWCHAAVERARLLDAARPRFWAYLSRALLLQVYLGQPEVRFPMQAARDDLDEAIALLDKVPEPRAARLVAICEAYIDLVRGDHASVLRRLEPVPLLGTPGNDDPDDFFVLTARGLCAMATCRIDEVFRSFYAAWLLAERTGPSDRLCAAAINLSGALANIDRVSEAIETLEPVFAQGHVPRGNLRLSTVAHMNLANYLGRVGRHEEACKRLMALLPALDRCMPGVRFGVAINLVESLMELRRFDEAAQHLAGAEAIAADDGRPSWLGGAKACAAELAWRQGRRDEAVVLLEAARAHFIADPCMNFAGVLGSRRLLAQWYAELGRFDLAYERQQEYQALYSRCTEDAARGQNAATRARQQLADQYALSSRERECLSWCAAGKTAWETGQILGVSEHTVAYHLDKVKRRFGLASKQQVVARAVSLGLVSPPAVPEPVSSMH